MQKKKEYKGKYIDPMSLFAGELGIKEETTESLCEYEAPRKERADNIYVGNTIEAYERFKLCVYMYNIFKWYRCRKISITNVARYFTQLYAEFVNFDNNISNLCKDILNDYGHKLGRLKSVHTCISTVTNYQVPSRVLDIPEVKLLYNSLCDKILNRLEKYINNVDVSKLAVSNYTRNLHWLLDELGLQDTKLRAMAELYTYVNIKHSLANLVFVRIIIESIEDCCICLGIDSYDKVLYDSYIGILFKLYDPQLQWSVINSIIRHVYTKEEYLEYFLSPINKLEEYRDVDFKHVKQFSYLKSILTNALKHHTKGINILLYGEPGQGKTVLAKHLITSISNNGWSVSDEYGKEESSSTNTTKYRSGTFKVARKLLDKNPTSLLLYDEAEDYFTDHGLERESKVTVNKVLEENTTPTIWTTNNIYDIKESYRRRFTYALEIGKLPESVYVSIIDRICKKKHIKLSNQVKDLCVEHRPSLGVISQAIDTYKLTGLKDQVYLQQALVDKLQLINNGEPIRIYNGKSASKFDYRLLNTSQDLHNICTRIKQSGRLDFSLLLYGVSGAGKTEYSRYLAKQLGIKVLVKKASDLESMYVGETEKNIARAFEEARTEKAMLIIDEGDHFISDRNNHQRSWETSRTEEMLQQIEYHEYPVIFTTNLINNIDKAAMRRFTYKVEFKPLTKSQIKIAWTDYFPNAKIPTDYTDVPLCPGDFNTVYKRASFEGYMCEGERIWKELLEEVRLRNEDKSSTRIRM